MVSLFENFFQRTPSHAWHTSMTHMKFMERRGSGLRKIVSETEKLPGYTEELRPEFHSTGTDFRVVLKNVNFNMDGRDQDTMQDTIHNAVHDEK